MSVESAGGSGIHSARRGLISIGAGPDKGYALVAAVVAVAAFAYLAMQVLAVEQGGVAVTNARLRQARLAAAADAGLALAIHGLNAKDRGQRWAMDGRPKTMTFGEAVLTVTVEDERAKAPIRQLDDTQARTLFAGAGATGEALEALVAEFRDWQTAPGANGESVMSHLPPPDDRPVRHAPIVTVGELAGLRDMTPEIFSRIATVVTVFFEDGGAFDSRHAAPLARAVMEGDPLARPERPDAGIAINGQDPLESLADGGDLVGRAVTVRIVARDRGGAQTHRTEVVEFTGDANQPYWIRFVE